MTGFGTYNPMVRQNYEQNLKNIIEQASGQLQQLQQMQIPQAMPTNLTQNFQLTPQSNNPNELQSSYVNNIDEVRNIFMTKNGIFVDKDFTTLWFKNTEGKIRIFALIEAIEKDEKDEKIEQLEKQISEMKSLITHQNNIVQNVPENIQHNNYNNSVNPNSEKRNEKRNK